MPFPFRRVDPRRAELEELHRQIVELQNELAVLESTTGEDESTDATPAPAAADIYQSVSRLRVTMVRREVRTKRQQLIELVQREKELAQTLKLPPPRTAPKASPVAEGPNGKTPAPVSAPKPAAQAPVSTPEPATQAPAAAPKQASQPSTPPRTAAQPKPQTTPNPKPAREIKKTSINILNVSIAIVVIVIILGIGLVLSGLLEIDPNKPYGFLSTVARLIQGATAGWMRP